MDVIAYFTKERIKYKFPVSSLLKKKLLNCSLKSSSNKNAKLPSLGNLMFGVKPLEAMINFAL